MKDPVTELVIKMRATRRPELVELANEVVAAARKFSETLEKSEKAWCDCVKEKVSE